MRLGHIGSDFAEHTLLRVGWMERKDTFDGISYRIIQAKGDSRLCLLLSPLQFQTKLNKKQFFEDQPDV